MSKSVYICGDSFGVSDPEYGPNWADMLAETFTVTNLSRVCASNLMISMQVDEALSAIPDYIICLGTSCTRQEVRFGSTIVPYSINSIDDTTQFNTQQREILQTYTKEFFDLDISIYQSKCIIENTLQKLIDSCIRFKFDQGGFEHKSYAKTDTYYFSKYQEHIAKINLWDYPVARSFRPYYHITDIDVHKMIAEYYTNLINND